MTNRSKKTVLFLSALVLTAVLVFILAACSLSAETPGGGNAEAATLTGIEITVADGSTLTYQGGKIVMTLGQIRTVQKSDLTVNAVYSDGTKSAITDFTLDASSLTTDAMPGTYTVMVSYQQYTATVTVDVVDARAALPTIEGTTVYSFEYSGEEIDIVAKLDEGRAEADKIATLLKVFKKSIIK